MLLLPPHRGIWACVGVGLWMAELLDELDLMGGRVSEDSIDRTIQVCEVEGHWTKALSWSARKRNLSA